MTNRLHTFTRWPLDPGERFDLAETDLAFVAALRKCGIGLRDDHDLDLPAIQLVAVQQLTLAKMELNRG